MKIRYAIPDFESRVLDRADHAVKILRRAEGDKMRPRLHDAADRRPCFGPERYPAAVPSSSHEPEFIGRIGHNGVDAARVESRQHIEAIPAMQDHAAVMEGFDAHAAPPGIFAARPQAHLHSHNSDQCPWRGPSSAQGSHPSASASGSRSQRMKAKVPGALMPPPHQTMRVAAWSALAHPAAGAAWLAQTQDGDGRCRNTSARALCR